MNVIASIHKIFPTFSTPNNPIIPAPIKGPTKLVNPEEI